MCWNDDFAHLSRFDRKTMILTQKPPFLEVGFWGPSDYNHDFSLKNDDFWVKNRLPKIDKIGDFSFLDDFFISVKWQKCIFIGQNAP